eukprot:CAMPEP_0171800918 /NCGR_PEP_ID=MMETSP0991-20121206/71958_1 /TAXON_ID=483369 /ORGANISM="non described non described, Strain CCMP2098" /LENGTH=192 /DNA_ID=CAMNT_0012412505 /DNA_START=70 /DNA_END=647 /DNA_ORIENTATION=-
MAGDPDANASAYLVAQELYVSAEKLGAFLMCSAVPDLPITGPGSQTESLTLYADALFGKGEYQRALSYYKQAMQRRKVGSHMDLASNKRASPGRQRSSPTSGFAAVSSEEEAMLKFKEGRCLVALDDTSAAIRALESVPPPLRSLRLLLLLGGVYVSTGAARGRVRVNRGGQQRAGGSVFLAGRAARPFGAG